MSAPHRELPAGLPLQATCVIVDSQNVGRISRAIRDSIPSHSGLVSRYRLAIAIDHGSADSDKLLRVWLRNPARLRLAGDTIGGARLYC
jgi:hypothetical protein